MYLAWKVLNQKALLEHFKPIHENVYAHHCTVAFGMDAINRYLSECKGSIETRISLIAESHVADNKGQAIGIAQFEGLSLNEWPHITISCANGVKPVYSNELRHVCGKFDKPFFVDVELQFFS